MVKENKPSQLIQLLIKVLMNLQILALLGALFFILFFIDTDYLVNPQLKALEAKDNEVKTQSQTLGEKTKEQEQFQILLKQVEKLETVIPKLKPGDSPKVVAAKEEKRLIDMARSAPDLPEPHNYRDFISIKNDENERINIFKDEPDTPPLNLWKFDYTMEVGGTYTALSDFLNQLVLSDHLFVINKVIIELDKEKLTKMPNPGANPNYPIPLLMSLSLTLYLNEAS